MRIFTLTDIIQFIGPTNELRSETQNCSVRKTKSVFIFLIRQNMATGIILNIRRANYAYVLWYNEMTTSLDSAVLNQNDQIARSLTLKSNSQIVRSCNLNLKWPCRSVPQPLANMTRWLGFAISSQNCQVTGPKKPGHGAIMSEEK